MLSNRIKGLSRTHDISCAIYTTSLLTLYTSSTLYHSFFSLQHTKYVFEVFDKCGKWRCL
jgi:channel protein (hemolysin III family)